MTSRSEHITVRIRKEKSLFKVVYPPLSTITLKEAQTIEGARHIAGEVEILYRSWGATVTVIEEPF
jgi:hypothetical protein